MYIKKSVLVVGSIILALVVCLGTIMFVNPFGALQFEDLFKFNLGVGVLKHYYYEDVDGEKLLDGALLGASYSVEDPYTVYMDKEYAQSYVEGIESDDYSGVGLYITTDVEDNRITVVSPLADSPAEKAGIVTGDKILEIDGEPITTGETIEEVAANMKGEEGTPVKLTILKKANGETSEVTLNRAVIKRETVECEMVDNDVAYIKITQFGVNTYNEFVTGFNGLVEKGMEYLVLDLRNNPGGYIDAAVKIADCFVEEGDIVYTLNKQGRKREYKATAGATKVPIVVLTNGGTASASEVLLGALKDYGLAKSLGEKTFGKGVTQIPYQLYDGSILKVTDSRYYTPKGVCIDKTGITPDIEMKMSDESYSRLSELTLGEDAQLQRAVEELKTK